MLKNVLDERENLRKHLFVRGFLLTQNTDINGDEFPFYGAWKCTQLNDFNVWTHPLTGFHYITAGEATLFLLGHAYNPFTMETSEEACLLRIGEHLSDGRLYDYIDELTGIFVLGIISNGELQFLTDPAGIQSACCGVIDSKLYLTSHAQLVADICNLKITSFVQELVEYKWYNRVMGPYLPADLTPFAELKRIVPNNEYHYRDGEITHKRFYPIKEIRQVETDEEYQAVIESAADILKNGMKLVCQKWERPWISLTGGIDSNTTFAAANGAYEKVHAFSYYSAEKEMIDCEAAKKIAAKFNVPWKLFEIPQDASQLKDYDIKHEILMHNNSYVAKTPENELRKRVYLEEKLSPDADVEVKSWVSETIRGYWYKYYGRKTMPSLSGKLFRNLYKIFITNRALAHKVDKLFDKYIEDYEYRKIPSQYPPADMHYFELGWGSWGSLNISEMKFYSDITIIYNNRKFLDMMFRVPLEKRIPDRHHLDMKKYLNPELYNMGIRVVNYHETKFRAWCLNVIFTINTLLPF